MKYNSKIMDRLEFLAIENNTGWARLGAAIVHKNKIVATGVNSLKTHPFQAKYGKNDQSICLHAEIAAIRGALRCISVDDLADTDLYVLRMKKNGPNGTNIRGMAKPCSGCMRAIIEFGIENVYYTNEDGDVEQL